MSVSKSHFLFAILVSALFFGLYTQTALAASLKVGDIAPDFSLKNQNEKLVSLSQYKGHWVVLYFTLRMTPQVVLLKPVAFATISINSLHKRQRSLACL